MVFFILQFKNGVQLHPVKKCQLIKREDMMIVDKEKVKEMICEAIDNVPECAEIIDCYTEHSYGDCQAFIKLVIKVKDTTDENLLEFHDIAHNAFYTDMGFIS